MTMTTVKHPELYVYTPNLSLGNDFYWCKGHPGEQGVIIATPHSDGGKFLLSTKQWPDYHMYVTKTIEGHVKSFKGDPGPQGHWKFTIKNFRNRSFVLTTCQWPEWHIYLYEYFTGHMNVRTKKGDPGPLGEFILHDLTSPDLRNAEKSYN